MRKFMLFVGKKKIASEHILSFLVSVYQFNNAFSLQQEYK